MAILSITSHVCYGHVGGQASVLPLQLAGYEVWHVPTVLFSNHPAHGGFRGEATADALFADLVAGLVDGGFLAGARALHTGYLGSAGQAKAALGAWQAIRASNREALYVCDPVLGDAGRVYVRPEVVAAVRDRLLPVADLATPNRFELGVLTGRPVDSLAAVLDALQVMRAMGPAIAVCTSAIEDDDRLLSIVASPAGFAGVSVPRLPRAPQGTGDLLTALLLADLLRDGEPAKSLCRASDVLHAVIADSLAAGSAELTLIASRERLAGPVPAVARIVPVPA